MSILAAPSSSTGAPVDDDGARELTEHLIQLVRLTQVARNRFRHVPGHDRDRAAYRVLQVIGRLAPVRQRDLADSLRAEASTLSRHVTFLTEKGLVHRLPDDRDGRACLLELTESGAALIDDLRRRRESSVADLLVDWTPAERSAFTGLLGRFVEDLAALLDGDVAPTDGLYATRRARNPSASAVSNPATSSLHDGNRPGGRPKTTSRRR